MQYILTKEEYANLVSKEKYEAALAKIEKLNKQVLDISNHTCIKETGDFGYCDFCPITTTCTQFKRYSK